VGRTNRIKAQPEHRDVDEVRAEITDGKRFRDADDEPSCDGTPDVAHAADDHRRDALETDEFAHEGMHLPVVDREHDAGKCSKDAGHQKDKRHDAIDVDTEQHRRIGVLGDRAQPAAEPRVLEQE
jgi:hypothetical protein